LDSTEPANSAAIVERRRKVAFVLSKVIMTGTQITQALKDNVSRTIIIGP
jgi:hypothetical protein